MGLLSDKRVHTAEVKQMELRFSQFIFLFLTSSLFGVRLQPLGYAGTGGKPVFET